MSDQVFRPFPTKRYCVRLMVRGGIVYALLRGMTMAASAALSVKVDQTMPEPGWSLGFWPVVSLFLVSLFLVSLSAKRRRELPVLQNLGVDPRLTYALALAAPFFFELVVWLA